jgi:hypothetical protein
LRAKCNCKKQIIIFDICLCKNKIFLKMPFFSVYVVTVMILEYSLLWTLVTFLITYTLYSILEEYTRIYAEDMYHTRMIQK